MKNTPSPQEANGDVGAPKEWYSRGYLPHRDAKALLQAVTFRLADSLPQEKLTLLEEELSNLPENQRPTHRREKIEQWLDAGMGCCALRHPKLAEQIRKALQHFDRQRYRLLAWCIMPNHVHVLMETLTPIARIIQGWKSVTARWALSHNEELKLGIPDTKQLWMRDYWDRYIRNDRHFENTVLYIHQTPSKPAYANAPKIGPGPARERRGPPRLQRPTRPTRTLARPSPRKKF